MSTNPTTIFAPGALVGTRPSAAQESVRRTRAALAVGVLSLATIVGISLLIVVLAANRPSFLVPASHNRFYPGWLAGPLGGAWSDFTHGSNVLKYVFTLGLVVMYGAYIVALSTAPRLRARWAIGAVVLVHAVMLLSPPLSLTDVFNYINYGRIEIVHHLNPYVTIPYFEPHSDPAFYLSNWHHLLSPYGPLFTLGTFALVPLGVTASFWVLKVILMLASLGTIALVWACARMLNRNPVQAIVFVGLNPLVLIWGLGGDHNDFLMMFLIVLAFYLLLRARSLRAPARAVAEAVTLRIPAGASEALAIAQGSGGGIEPVPGGAGVGPAAGAAAVGPAPGGAGVGPAAGVGEIGNGRGPQVNGGGWRARNGALGALSLRRPGGAVAARLASLVWPLAPLDVAAGAVLVTAVAIKASAGILLPVVLMALLVRPRDLAQVLIGVLGAAVVLAAASYAAFGAHLPDLSTQARLITPVSVPNLLGLALGQGGETQTLRTVMTGILVLSVVASAWWASRHRDLGPDALVTGAGWASVVLVLTLSWVLPWYVLWTLPLAVLSRSRALRTAVLVLGVYLIFAWMPLQADLFKAINFHPLGTPLGAAHQRETKALLH